MEAIIQEIRILPLHLEVRMTQINRPFFFTHVRRMMFSNNLQQSQVDGMNAILDGWEAKYTADDDRWLAYALATTYHETDQHMQPINEYGKGRGRPYGKVIQAQGRSITAAALCN
jgi:putative chitinase